MLRVKDIMTPEVFTLEFDASAEEAAWALTRRSISGAPVRDAEGKLTGFLSKTDLVDPSPDDWVERKKATVGDLMMPAAHTVYADDPALNAAKTMADQRIHHVMVLDEESELCGIVTALDVVRALAEGQRFEPE